MAALNITSSNRSPYSLALAYALIVLSLSKVDAGLVGRPGFTSWKGNSAVPTALAPTVTGDESRFEVYRLFASIVEPSDATPSPRVGADPENEELRRLTALALIVYLVGDGIDVAKNFARG
jgi:hypothetical protein